MNSMEDISTNFSHTKLYSIVFTGTQLLKHGINQDETPENKELIRRNFGNITGPNVLNQIR